MDNKMRFAVAQPILDVNLRCKARVTEILGDFDTWSSEAQEVHRRYRDSFLVQITDKASIGDCINVHGYGHASKEMNREVREELERTFILRDDENKTDLRRIEHVLTQSEMDRAGEDLRYGINLEAYDHPTYGSQYFANRLDQRQLH